MNRSVMDRENLVVIRESPLLVRCEDCGAEFLTAIDSFKHECDAKAFSWAEKEAGEKK